MCQERRALCYRKHIFPSPASHVSVAGDGQACLQPSPLSPPLFTRSLVRSLSLAACLPIADGVIFACKVKGVSLSLSRLHSTSPSLTAATVAAAAAVAVPAGLVLLLILD